MENVSKMTEYHLWWDGRTTDRAMVTWDGLKNPTSDPNARVMAGNKMCRNGRYFVVLTIRDFNGKEKNYMKQVVLIK
jgi:phage terminase large subunit-like protein